MKIKYKFDITNNLDFFNDYYGTIIQKNRIIKNKKIINNFLNHNIKYEIVYSLIFLLTILFKVLVNPPLQWPINIYLAIIIFYMIIFLINIIYFIIGYRKFLIHGQNDSGELIIDKTGIRDTTKDHEIFFEWKNINYCIISKNFVFIIPNKLVIFFFPINIKDKIIPEISKYSKDIKIIETQTKE